MGGEDQSGVCIAPAQLLCSELGPVGAASATWPERQGIGARWRTCSVSWGPCLTRTAKTDYSPSFFLPSSALHARERCILPTTHNLLVMLLSWPCPAW